MPKFAAYQLHIKLCTPSIRASKFSEQHASHVRTDTELSATLIFWRRFGMSINHFKVSVNWPAALRGAPEISSRVAADDHLLETAWMKVRPTSRVHEQRCGSRSR
jgi:hypothetical protein